MPKLHRLLRAVNTAASLALGSTGVVFLIGSIRKPILLLDAIVCLAAATLLVWVQDETPPPPRRDRE